MKRTFALLIGVAACAAFARAGDVQVKAKMMTNPEGEETTTFGGDAAPKGTKIDEKTLNAEGDTNDGVFSLSKPTNGWPVGKYHVEIYVNDKLVTKLNFTIKAAAKSKKRSDDEEKESGD
jgi:outer membrane usher protein FimD/PapC